MFRVIDAFYVIQKNIDKGGKAGDLFFGRAAGGFNTDVKSPIPGFCHEGKQKIESREGLPSGKGNAPAGLLVKDAVPGNPFHNFPGCHKFARQGEGLGVAALRADTAAIAAPVIYRDSPGTGG
jgi:hypothetical protein